MRDDYTFHGLAAAGFQHLLPIVPHDAAISINSRSLKAPMLGKVPGQKRSDGWVGFAKWEAHSATPKDLDQWASDEAGIGLRCHDVVALDIDVTDPVLAETLTKLALEHLGPAPCRVGNPPKRLLVYRQSEAGEFASKLQLSFMDEDVKHLVEVLGAKQQFIIQGTHPTTLKPYTWDADLEALSLDGLTTVSFDEMMGYLHEVRSTLDMLGAEVGDIKKAGQNDSRDTASLTGDVALVRKLVGFIPNTDLDGYQELTTMAHAIWASCQDDIPAGEDILLEWAAKWPNEPDLTEASRIYGTIHESSIGIQWLQDQARQSGASTAMDDFAEAEDTRDDLDEKSFWTRYIYVNQIKRFIDTLTGERMDKEQFNDRLGKLGDNQTASSFFMEKRWPTQFCNQLDYQPGSKESVVADSYGGYRFNAWRPGPAHNTDWRALKSDPAALQMWMRLVTHLFPKREERAALLDWMAYLLQKPGNKPNWHPLIGGHTHGTGKDSILIPLMKGLGENAVTIRTGDLESEWTWWAENVQLVVVSEINSFERRAVMNRLKSFMANPPYTVEINKKGMPQYEVPNLFGMVMFTNNEDAVAIEQSDRRFFVMWTDAEPLPEDFYVQYHELFSYSDAGAASVVRYLLERDIQGRNFQGRAPATEAKENMRQAAMPLVEGQLLAAIETGEGAFHKDLLTLQEIDTFLRARAGGRPVSPQKLGIHLKAVGGRCLGRVRLSTGERTRLWAVRRAEMYVSMDPTQAKDRYEEQQKAAAGADFEGVEAGL